MLARASALNLTRRVHSNLQVPADQRLKVGIVGGGLAGMVTAMDLSEAGHEVEIFEVGSSSCSPPALSTNSSTIVLVHLYARGSGRRGRGNTAPARHGYVLCRASPRVPARHLFSSIFLPSLPPSLPHVPPLFILRAQSRNFVGGKCGSWVDKDGNHIEMGLHVFFGCYYNLFGILERVGEIRTALHSKLEKSRPFHRAVPKSREGDDASNRQRTAKGGLNPV